MFICQTNEEDENLVEDLDLEETEEEEEEEDLEDDDESEDVSS